MAKRFEREGKFKGSFTWNRGRRDRDDDEEAEDWNFHDKD